MSTPARSRNPVVRSRARLRRRSDRVTTGASCRPPPVCGAVRSCIGAGRSTDPMPTSKPKSPTIIALTAAMSGNVLVSAFATVTVTKIGGATCGWPAPFGRWPALICRYVRRQRACGGRSHCLRVALSALRERCADRGAPFPVGLRAGLVAEDVVPLWSSGAGMSRSRSAIRSSRMPYLSHRRWAASSRSTR